MQEDSIMLELIPWLFTALSITGSYYNSYQDRKGFLFWLVSNTGFLTLFAVDGMYAQMVLFGVFIGFNINGLRQWK